MHPRRQFNLISAVVFVATMGIAVPQAANADPVDLRGKKGVVDPQDVKKDNPPERSLKIKEPPAPAVEKPKAEKAPYGVGPTAGGLPPADKGGAAIRATPKAIPR